LFNHGGFQQWYFKDNFTHCIRWLFKLSWLFILSSTNLTARITDHSETLIDNIFLNSIEHFVISGNVVYDLTDHLPNFVIFEKFSFLPSNVNMYRRDYSKLNELLDLIDDFQHVNWQTVLHVSTCNDPYLKDIGNRFFYWLFLFTFTGEKQNNTLSLL
jgi:hypothetical protein